MMTPTPEQALESAQRFIDHWFNNEGAKPQVRIPADPNDDDLILTAFIKNAAEVERERDAARAELSAAHRRIHGDESDECVFCNTKHRSPVNTGNQECPQCHLCTIEADTEGLRVERDAARARVAELEATLKANGFRWSDEALPPRWLPPHILPQVQEPLDRPDRPGWWWWLHPVRNEWLASLISTPDKEPDGQWLPATPPPVPVMSEKDVLANTRQKIEILEAKVARLSEPNQPNGNWNV